MTVRTARRFLVLAATFLAAACDGSPAGPAPPALRAEIVSGDMQRGLAGHELREPVVFRVVGPDGSPRSGVAVEPALPEGSGSVVLSGTATDARGLVSARWTPAGSGERTLTLRPSPDGRPATARSVALGPDETDVVVVEGAVGEVRGVLVLETPDPFSPRGLAILQEWAAPGTSVPIHPMDGGETDVLVFGSDNAPLLERVRWTPGVDTVRLALSPPVPLHLEITVFDGPFEERRAVVEEHLAALRDVFARESAGLALGEVEILDRTGRDVNVDIRGGCLPQPARTLIAVDYVTDVAGGNLGGYACRPSLAYMGRNSVAWPRLLAHEIGHLLALPHRDVGVMKPNPPGSSLTDGEIFRMHFDERSAVNEIFGVHTGDTARPCIVTLDGACIPLGYELPR